MSLTALTVKLIFLSSLEVPFVLVTVQGPNLHLVEENQAKFFFTVRSGGFLQPHDVILPNHTEC